VGPGASAEYLTYRDNLDLPDPEDVLAKASQFVIPSRADQLYVMCAGILAVVRSRLTADRWHAAGVVYERVAAAGHPDIAVSFARDWIRERPDGELPREDILCALIPLLKEARLM
jgi:hypothetical protein